MILHKVIFMVATAVILWNSAVLAKPPNRDPVPPAPEVYSVKVEYSENRILIHGANLASATVTLGGTTIATDGASTGTDLILPFSAEVSAIVGGPGSYVLVVTTGGGDFSLSAFIPFAIVVLPPGTGDCPCESEWDYYGGLSSPNGFSGINPYCAQDTGNFVTVQFYDGLASNFWVLWTEWSASTSSGYCELWVDGPYRELDAQEEFDACAAYLKDTYVWTGVGSDCLF